ncbi:hypothetical protein AbHV_ORF61_2 [Abalone herpesvirus Victoria/AUS/2009]|uniref:Uncharacterized protein n=1 Tax=Abalone herpesvirus (isolate Abalone/Australia/Victoria/2009) TaxID=1241371 RepID=K4JYH9_ABHV|nr:hypothetical protein AbHV_ORF61 [Abalone herpesvirus Victoria/AUS/2009]YP_006908766.1 hypothetical protein AbHV_ORF61_2 [Abalone herpesvirus Victoria/AUS/2009]AFU90073.1 hypothetical protein AbHV_ORF61 [Abalone herpesvirus Victoria/AUS/2009]AFU90126.1 hypothetical protein AbHV_ORF61_2 [Abalone herpesvirus Victoria/AUS/2009]
MKFVTRKRLVTKMLLTHKFKLVTRTGLATKKYLALKMNDTWGKDALSRAEINYVNENDTWGKNAPTLQKNLRSAVFLVPTSIVHAQHPQRKRTEARLPPSLNLQRTLTDSKMYPSLKIILRRKRTVATLLPSLKKKLWSGLCWT